MKHGRPTKQIQVNIQKKLRKYFEGGITAALAAQKTNLNIKQFTNILTVGQKRLQNAIHLTLSKGKDKSTKGQ